MIRIASLSAVVCTVASTLLVAPAMAQDVPATGIYVVARGGASISSDQKFDLDALPGSTTFDRKTRYKTGVTGQIGGGYDFGMFRVEQTVGYTSNDLDERDSRSGDLSSTGRSKSLSMTVAGYVDIPISGTIVPYVGGGVGAARVEAEQTRVNAATGQNSGYSGKDWGLLWHADAGVGINIRPKTTLEVGARYSQTSKLAFDGQDAGTSTTFEPTLRNISGTVGIRHIF